MVQVDQLPRDRKMVSIPRVERLSGFGNCSRNFFETHVSEDTLILLNLLLGPAAKLSLVTQQFRYFASDGAAGCRVIPKKT